MNASREYTNNLWVCAFYLQNNLYNFLFILFQPFVRSLFLFLRSIAVFYLLVHSVFPSWILPHSFMQLLQRRRILHSKAGDTTVSDHIKLIYFPCNRHFIKTVHIANTAFSVCVASVGLKPYKSLRSMIYKNIILMLLFLLLESVIASGLHDGWHGTPHAYFKVNLQYRVQTNQSSTSRWAWATYVVDLQSNSSVQAISSTPSGAAWTRTGFACRRSDIGKPTPAGLDRLRRSLRWREGVRTLLKSGIAATPQQSDIGKSHKMTPVQRVAPLIQS